MKNWKKGVIGIQLVPEIKGGSPAAVDTTTGIIYLATNKTKDLNRDEIAFLICHEFAHIELQSDDEKAVDARAFQLLAPMGFSLRASVTVMAKKFNFQTLEQKQRALEQLRRAYLYNKYGIL